MQMHELCRHVYMHDIMMLARHLLIEMYMFLVKRMLKVKIKH